MVHFKNNRKLATDNWKLLIFRALYYFRKELLK